MVNQHVHPNLIYMYTCVQLVLINLQGRVFYDNSLPDLSPRERRDLFVALTITLSQLHSIDWRGCGLAEYGGKGEYSSRQVPQFL